MGVRVALAGIFLVAWQRSADAQPSAWLAPASGYIYDSLTQNIRPIQGFIGSAYLGPAVLKGIGWASIAPNQKYALLVQDQAPSWTPDLGTASAAQLFDKLSSPQQANWAADSSQAVVLDAGDEPRLVWLAGFDISPVVVASWTLDGANTNWSLIAADGTAGKILLVSQSNGVKRLWLATPSAPPNEITPFQNPSAATFSRDGSVAFIADAGLHQIVRLENLETAPAQTVSLSSEAYVADPVGLATSPNASLLFLVDRSSQMVRTFDLATTELRAELPTEIAVDSLTAVSPTRFLLNSRNRTAGPLFLLDISDTAKVFFVPTGGEQ